MSDILQYVLAGIIVAAAVIAVARAIVLTVKNQRSILTDCAGCKLRDACQRPEKNSLKKCADKVAQLKKP